MDTFEDYLPLWLELHVDERSWLFELRSGEERAVVVGSHPSADVHIAGDGIASTHFHFEREAGGVVIVPGYRAALVVDRIRAPEPVSITKSAQVEFCGVRLEATVHDVPPLDMLPQADNRTDRTMRRPDYVDRLPKDTDPTVVAVAAAISPSYVAANRSDAGDEIDTMTTTAWRALPQPSAPIGPQGTLIIQRPTNCEAGPSAPVPFKTPALPPIAPAGRVRFNPWPPNDAASPQSSPTRVEVPRPRSSAPPRGGLAGTQRPSETDDDSARTHSLAPTEHAAPPIAKRASALARLGLAATRHPFRVALLALPVCVVVALAFVGAARLAGRYPVATTSRPPGSPPLLVRTTTSPSAVSARTPVAHAGASIQLASAAGSAPAPSPSFATTPAPSVSSTVARARPTAQRAPRPQRHVFLNK